MLRLLITIASVFLFYLPIYTTFRGFQDQTNINYFCHDFRYKGVRSLPALKLGKDIPDFSPSLSGRSQIQPLNLRDLFEVYSLVSREFSKICSSHAQTLSLNSKIFLFTLAKLGAPRFWGHTIFGIRDNGRLVGMIDLSLQETSGSLHVLKLKRVSSRVSHFVDQLKSSKFKFDNGHSEPISLQPYLCNLLVAGRDRRRGYASRLLSHCESLAVSEGFQLLHLHVENSDTAALQLYEKLGFMRKMEVGKEVIYMQKPLSLESRKQISSSN